MPTVHQATWGLLRALGVRKVPGGRGGGHGLNCNFSRRAAPRHACLRQ